MMVPGILVYLNGRLWQPVGDLVALGKRSGGSGFRRRLQYLETSKWRWRMEEWMCRPGRHREGLGVKMQVGTVSMYESFWM